MMARHPWSMSSLTQVPYHNPERDWTHLSVVSWVYRRVVCKLNRGIKIQKDGDVWNENRLIWIFSFWWKRQVYYVPVCIHCVSQHIAGQTEAFISFRSCLVALCSCLIIKPKFWKMDIVDTLKLNQLHIQSVLYSNVADFGWFCGIHVFWDCSDFHNALSKGFIAFPYIKLMYFSP